jgi:succinoglycan biosynthesis protein ExoA
MHDLKVSVLMPVRNEGACIRRSLNSVLAQDYPSERMEIIVADGMSSDGTREAVAEVSQQHTNVRMIDNAGKIVATGLNAGLRIATGEIIVRVDGHCEIASDYIRRSVARLRDGSVDCVGGPLETIGETYTARAIAAAMSSTFGVGGSAFRVGVSEPRFVDTVAFPAYKRDALQRVGEFDEELVRNQDDEYNYRLRKLGGRILLSPEIGARYYSRSGFASLWKQYFEYGYWKVRVLQKHPRQMQPRQFLPPLFVLAWLALLLTVPFLKTSQLLLIGIVSAYAALNLAFAVSAALRKELRLLPLIPIAFVVMHLAYGVGFLLGLVRFANRWTFSGLIKIAQASSDAAQL